MTIVTEHFDSVVGMGTRAGNYTLGCRARQDGSRAARFLAFMDQVRATLAVTGLCASEAVRR